MKRRLILLVVVIALIAGFGALLHSPPSIIDAVTGATPKAKKAAQSSAQLEGSYIFCMNPLLDKLSDEDIREQLKAFVTGKTDSIRTDTELSFDIYVSETDYALLRYADSLCERLNDAGADVQIKQYSGTMLRSRAVSGKYEAFLSESDLVSTDALENADYIILDILNLRKFVSHKNVNKPLFQKRLMSLMRSLVTQKLMTTKLLLSKHNRCVEVLRQT